MIKTILISAILITTVNAHVDITEKALYDKTLTDEHRIKHSKEWWKWLNDKQSQRMRNDKQENNKSNDANNLSASQKACKRDAEDYIKNNEKLSTDEYSYSQYLEAGIRNDHKELIAAIQGKHEQYTRRLELFVTCRVSAYRKIKQKQQETEREKLMKERKNLIKKREKLRKEQTGSTLSW